jgi:Uma2 family endonuclease
MTAFYDRPVDSMSAIPELIEQPLTREALAERYRALCDGPRFANLPGKIELDAWGRMILSPASNIHGIYQARLAQSLQRGLGGVAIVEASISTNPDVRVADVAWASPEFMRTHGHETPFTKAPEICIEVASPSNSRRELHEKIAAYLAAGAVEASRALRSFGSTASERVSGRSARVVRLTRLLADSLERIRPIRV